MTRGDAEPSANPELERRFERARRGDRTAQEELIAAELPRLRAFIRLRAGAAVRAAESTSDLMQSICREVLEGLDSIDYRGEAAFRNWLYRAAERKIIDRARRLAAVRRGGDAVTESLQSSDQLRATYATLLTPSRNAVAREEIVRIESAFENLRAEHREVITLAKIVGLPHAEIATQMGRSEGAVRVLLFRALAELAERLRGE